MGMLSEGNFSQINKNINELKDRMNSLDTITTEKNKNLKKQLLELEDK